MQNIPTPTAYAVGMRRCGGNTTYEPLEWKPKQATVAGRRVPGQMREAMERRIEKRAEHEEDRS